jgi:hypothetical protein
MTELDADKIGFSMWKGWTKDECRGRLFGVGPKEEEILVDHAEFIETGTGHYPNPCIGGEK